MGGRWRPGSRREILPGIFRLDDPCVRLRLAPEGRLALEEIVAGLPAEVFAADDALGWVYQFWQKEKKDEVNASERKIGGADLGAGDAVVHRELHGAVPVGELVWGRGGRPATRTVRWSRSGSICGSMRRGEPAAGTFEGWPDTVAEVTVMDPCCGSGHFLVEAFSMLWRMRAEEEGLDPVAAQDAVLRDNLFGLELDPRCVQIAMFAVALQAWKAGGGWRELPVPNIACSGIPVKAPVEEWKALADGDERLRTRWCGCTSCSGTPTRWGRLIDPKRAAEITDPTGLQQSFEDVDWDEIAPCSRRPLAGETDDPPPRCSVPTPPASPEPPTTSPAIHTRSPPTHRILTDEAAVELLESTRRQLIARRGST